MSQRAQIVNCLSFNQDGSCLAVGTQQGFKVFRTHPFALAHTRAIDGGVKIVQMLNTTSLVAAVSPSQPRHVPLYNLNKEGSIVNLVFDDTVLNVLLNVESLVVVLERSIFLFSLSPSVVLTNTIQTDTNPRGLCVTSSADANNRIAFPRSVSESQRRAGDVMVVSAQGSEVSFIRAHSNAVVAMAINKQGTRLATASAKGTLIRVFGVQMQNSSNSPLLCVLNRGMKPATVYSLAFNGDSTQVICSSNRSTIHVWVINTPDEVASTHHEPGSVGDVFATTTKKEGSWLQFSSPACQSPNQICYNPFGSVVLASPDSGGVAYVFTHNIATRQHKKEAEYPLR